MKLRFQGDSLRLRLTRSEVAKLHDSGEVSETVTFRSGGALKYCLRTSAGAEAVQAERIDGNIFVSAPLAMVQRWVTSDEVGIYERDGELNIAIEKDSRCLRRTEDIRESDAYPHPGERCFA